jgi:hypothetical protein
MNPEPSLQSERDQRIEELESSIRRSSSVGVKIPVAVMAMIVSTFLFAMERREIGYFFASRTPIQLGAEGEYRLDRLESNRYAQLHGIPTLRGAYLRQKDATFVVIGVAGTPILVRRHAVAGEDWTSGSTPPRPNQRPFSVRGRLLSARDASQYKDAFATLASLGELTAAKDGLWILLEGERPGSNPRTPLFAAALLLFFGVNAWLCWRAIQERFHRSSAR